MKYRPEIDGLRAVAVIPVVLFHLKLAAFGGGFVGVDVFFVISGYLITSLIVKDIEDGRFSILNFYERRARRILPALFAVVLFSSVVASILFTPGHFTEFGNSVVATILFYSNISFWSETGYFATPSDLKPLLHTWSLAVEEQFYILFPLTLLLVARFAAKWLVVAILAIASVSLVLSVWAVSTNPSAAFFLAPSRAWELMLGALLALGVVPQPNNRTVQEIVSVAGLGLIGWAVFTFSTATPFPGLNALFPCVGATLVIYAGSTNRVARLLAAKPVVFLGLISYSLYLWHWPLIVFTRYHLLRDPAGWEIAVIIVLSFFMAVLSWRFIETPLRGRSGLFSQAALFQAAGLAMVSFLVAGIWLPSSQGWRPAFAETLNADFPEPENRDLGNCHVLRGNVDAEWRRENCTLNSGGKTNALLWGDSFAAHYARGFVSNSERLTHNLLQYTAGGCTPAFNFDPALVPGCRDFNRRVLDILERFDIKTVVLAGRWQQAFEYGLSLTEISDTVARLQRLGIKVIVIGQSPVFPIDIGLIARKNGASEHTSNLIASSLNKAIERSVPGTTFIDPIPVLCAGATCRFRDGANFYFTDDGHLSDYGSEFFVRHYLSILDGRL